MKSPHLGRFDPMPLVLGPVVRPAARMTAEQIREAEKHMASIRFEKMPHETYASGGVVKLNVHGTGTIRFGVDVGQTRDEASIPFKPVAPEEPQPICGNDLSKILETKAFKLLSADANEAPAGLLFLAFNAVLNAVRNIKHYHDDLGPGDYRCYLAHISQHIQEQSIMSERQIENAIRMLGGREEVLKNPYHFLLMVMEYCHEHWLKVKGSI